MTPYLRFSLKASVLSLLTILCVLSILLLAYFLNSSVPIARSEKRDTEIPQQQDDPDENKPHWLVGSYYSTKNGLSATLLLNNKGIKPLEVHPTIYSEAGESIEIQPITLEEKSFRMIDIKEWAAFGGESFAQGNIRLFHVGKDLVLGAQIYVTDEAKSLSYEEKLAEVNKFDSRRLEGVWWMPSRESEVEIVLSNTADVPLQITAQLSKIPNLTGTAHFFQLAAHETRVLNLCSDFIEGENITRSEVIALSLEHNGEKSALLARAVVREIANGYSNVVQFSNPIGAKSAEYQGVGFQIDEVGGEQLTPIIVAKNVGTDVAIVKAHVPYTRADGSTGIVELPQTRLQAGEMRLLKTQQIMARSRREQIQIAGLEIEYDSVPGSVVVNAHSVSLNGNQVFRVPMWDPLAQKSPTGGYPWRIEKSSTTKTYIKNITDREQYYVASLRWTNGEGYMIGMKPIAPHQTIEIDVKKLRDEQVPDVGGRLIPMDLTSGQLMWSLKQVEAPPPSEKARQALALIGRSEQIDLEHGISSNYSCQSCCLTGYFRSYVSPSSSNVSVGTPVDFEVYEEDKDCYGYVTLPYLQTFASWTSSNTSTATVNSSGTATTVGVGETTIRASWTAERYDLRFVPCSDFSPGAPNCYDCNNPTVVFPTPSTTLQVIGVQKLQYQSGTNFVDIAGTLHVLKDTSVTFKAIPNPSTETFPSNQPVWSGTSGASGTGPTTTVTFSTISSNTTDHKTVIATAGTSTRTVQVIVYSLTAVLTPQDNFTGRSLTNFGPSEVIALSFTASPSVTASQAGGLLWKQTTGTGTLTGASDGTGSYTAAAAAESVTLKLEIQAGPSKTLGPFPGISVIGPSGAFQVQAPSTGIKHVQGTCSAGFRAHTYLTPMTVSFAHIEAREGTTTSAATGWLSNSNGVTHNVGSWFAVSNCAANTGCQIQAIDTIYNEYPQNFGGTPWGVGDFQWNIPRQWRVGTGSAIQFTSLLHHFVSDAAGKGTISKGGAGPFSKNANDATSNF